MDKALLFPNMANKLCVWEDFYHGCVHAFHAHVCQNQQKVLFLNYFSDVSLIIF